MSPVLKRTISIFCIFLSALYAYSLVSVRSFYFPTTGLALIFTTLSAAVFLLKKQKTFYDRILFVITTILSLCIIFRANEFLTFLNIISILYFGSLLIMNSKERESVPLYQLFILPPLNVFRFLGGENIFKLEIKDYSRSISSKKIQDISLSLIITGGIFIVIVPLLASANPIFQKLVEDIAKSLNVFTFITTFLGPLFVPYVLRLLLFVFFAIWIPRIFTAIVQTVKHDHKIVDINLPLLLPKILTGLLLLIFFITQIQLYFSSAETLKAMGMMNREYAREVFAQLSVVSFIIFVLLYADRGTSKLNRITSYILTAEIIFLNCIAFKSVYDYTVRFGFTHKRLWGYTSVIWLFGTVILYLYSYKKILLRNDFVRNIIVFSGVLLIGVNIANFDYLIFHVSRSRTGEGVDHNYLVNNVSADAIGYKQHLGEIMEVLKNNHITYRDTEAAYIIVRQIWLLQNKYSAKNIDWRHFNVSEYLEYKEIKNIDTEKYDQIINRRVELLQKSGK